MSTLTVLFAATLGVLLYTVYDAVAQSQLTPHHSFNGFPSPYSYQTVPTSQQFTVNNVQMGQYRQPAVNQPSVTSSNTASSNNQVSPATFQHRLQYVQPGRSATSYGPSVEYNQPGTVENGDFNHGSSLGNHGHDNSANRDTSAGELQSQGPGHVPVVLFRRYYHPELSADPAQSKEKVEKVKTQLPSHDDVEELYENYDQSEQPEDSEDEDTSGSSKSVHYETLKKPYLSSPSTPKPPVLSVQHLNYPIAHPGTVDKFLKVASRLYLNPELHDYLYNVTADSIHDSAVLPEAQVKGKSQQATTENSKGTKQTEPATSEKEEEEESLETDETSEEF